jgi:hypothetical protein
MQYVIGSFQKIIHKPENEKKAILALFSGKNTPKSYGL